MPPRINFAACWNGYDDIGIPDFVAIDKVNQHNVYNLPQLYYNSININSNNNNKNLVGSHVIIDMFNNGYILNNNTTNSDTDVANKKMGANAMNILHVPYFEGYNKNNGMAIKTNNIHTNIVTNHVHMFYLKANNSNHNQQQQQQQNIIDSNSSSSSNDDNSNNTTKPHNNRLKRKLSSLSSLEQASSSLSSLEYTIITANSNKLNNKRESELQQLLYNKLKCQLNREITRVKRYHYNMTANYIMDVGDENINNDQLDADDSENNDEPPLHELPAALPADDGDDGDDSEDNDEFDSDSDSDSKAKPVLGKSNTEYKQKRITEFLKTKTTKYDTSV